MKIWTAQSSVIVLLLAVIACTGAPRPRPKGGPVDQGPGSVTAARKYLEGRWTLESFEVFPPGKPAVTLTGQGTLLYDQFGNLTSKSFAIDKYDQTTFNLLTMLDSLEKVEVITEGNIVFKSHASETPVMPSDSRYSWSRSATASGVPYATRLSTSS